MEKQKTIAIDLDGTLLQYSGHLVSGHPEEPLEGAKELVERLISRGHRVVVFTARGRTKETHMFLVRHGFPELEVTNRKFGFEVMLDDRAINFPGPSFYNDIDKAVDIIENYKPWWKK